MHNNPSQNLPVLRIAQVELAMDITIGIPCFNERRNIGALLDALLSQRESDEVKIRQIIVSDESDDDTASIVEEFVRKDPRIKLYRYSHRRGKPSSINEIFETSKGNVVVLFDADVVPRDDDVVLNLVKPMRNDSSIGICGGAAVALKPRNPMERMAFFTYKVWKVLREEFRGGSSFFAIHGKIIAVSANIVKRVRLPREVIGDDSYLYLSCVKLGYKTRFVRDAIVYYRETSTLHDFLIRRTKYEYNLRELIATFGDFARREVRLPRLLLLRISLREGIRDPTGLFLMGFFVLWSKLIARRGRMTALWPIAVSTKQLDLRSSA
jgi:cellulose synthase/poly-beta-1,6-N-acetylglucosamine synthase-like glycosyltransferase